MTRDFFDLALFPKRQSSAEVWRQTEGSAISCIGAALWYRDLWYLWLWRAADIPTWAATYGFTPSRLSGAIVIGSDGGSEGIVLDTRPERADGNYPIYAINFVSIDWEDALLVAPDFRSLLLLRHELLGR